MITYRHFKNLIVSYCGLLMASVLINAKSRESGTNSGRRKILRYTLEKSKRENVSIDYFKTSIERTGR